MFYFDYGEEALAHLKKRDKKLAAVIAAHGMIKRSITPNLFEALVSNIIAQQISTKGAETVTARLYECAQGLTPSNLAALDAGQIQACGMTLRKAGYIRDIAHSVHNGTLDLESLGALPDTEVIATLSAQRGLGVWTAEMLLIFSLMRPNVLSWGDLAIQRGMANVYGRKSISRDFFERCRKRYTPYCSVASLYLWASS